jgi:hypothetical protein
VVKELVVNQSWRYRNASGRGGHPMVYPPDPAQPPLAVPTTPGDRRSFANWVSQVRHRGGHWPRATP